MEQCDTSAPEQHAGSDFELAIDRALQAADLRPGDSIAAQATVLAHQEPSAVEAGDVVSPAESGADD